jgi:Zn-dependent M28 family amino/carboxypeptidase
MELARIFHESKPKRTLRFVFFNVEEPGLVGSRKYAAAAKRAMDRPAEEGKPQRRVVAMLSLEMLGYYCDEPGCQKSPIPAIPGVWEPPTTGDFLAIATTASHNWLGELIEREWKRAQPDFKLIRPSFIPDIPNTPADLLRSDHAPFLFIGVPAAMIADTANFRSPHYHQPTDTIQTIDARRFVSAVRGLAGVVEALGNGDVPAPTSKLEPVREEPELPQPSAK